jgi:hypothetical protein
MKNLLFLLLLSTAGMADSCNEKADGAIIPGETFSMKAGEHFLCKECDNLILSLEKVLDDSRCPEGVNCIWAGHVKVAVQVLQNKEMKKIELGLEEGKKGLAEAKIGGYTLKLEKVSPYPKDGQKIKPEEYVVDFRLRE